MKDDLRKTLKNSLALLCPRCGGAGIYAEKLVLRERCPACGLAIGEREPDTWFFMYMSTAGITGIFLFVMFFIVRIETWTARSVMIALAVGAFFLTLRVRKSIAIAIDYLL